MDCDICSGKADTRFNRVEVWHNKLWRLTLSLYHELGGFCYLEPKRHIEDITKLDGDEAATFGTVLATISNTLKEITGAKLIYVYIFGGTISHLHVHLAPHRDDDLLYNDILKEGAEVKPVENYPEIPPQLSDKFNQLSNQLYNE